MFLETHGFESHLFVRFKTVFQRLQLVIPKVRYSEGSVNPKVRYSEGSLFRRSVIPKVR